jgi:hypothetical protein
MTKLPYEQALERIRAEYQEMPGLKLTLEQVQRLSGVDKAVCRQVLDALVNAKFLYLGTDGSYTRSVDGSIRSRTVKAGRSAGFQSPASRRAS